MLKSFLNTSFLSNLIHLTMQNRPQGSFVLAEEEQEAKQKEESWAPVMLLG